MTNIHQVDRKTMKKHGDGMGDNVGEPLEIDENEKEPNPPMVTEKQVST
jgi:hypothetical protein